MDFNIIATAYRGEGTYLLKALGKMGEFERTPFRDVLVGKVKDVNEFLDKILLEPPLSLARVVPVRDVFAFGSPDELVREIKERLDRISLQKGKSFKVTVERRGWKGVINSHEFEKMFGEILHEKTGNQVDLTHPQEEVVFEIMDNSCGWTIITEEMRRKYFFVRAK